MNTQSFTSRVPSTVGVRVAGVSPWAAAVWLGAAMYSVLLSIESIREYRRFETQWDLAIYDQLLWLLAHGHEPFSTVITRPLLEAHFQPGLILLTPLYWLDLGVPGLLTAQSIALALTAPALFALARASGASSVMAALPAFLWLVCPFVASVNLFEFRPDPFAPALIVVSVLAALQRRHVLLVATAVLALSLKEDIALTYVMLGLLLVVHGRQRLGVILALGSAAWYVAAISTMNALGGSNEAFARRFAGERGDSVGEAFLWMVEHPLELLGDVAVDSLGDVLLLLLSTGGLALLAPAWLLLSLPTALHNALSAYGVQQDLVHHYHLGTLTGFFVAAAIGAGRLHSLARLPRLSVYALASVAAIVAVGVGLSVHGALSRAIPRQSDAIELALERIPRDAPVAATWSLIAHLSHRVEVYSLPEPFLSAEWGTSLTAAELAERAERVRFVVYRDVDVLPSGGYSPPEDLATVTRMLRRRGFIEVERVGNVHVLERPGNGR